MFNEVMELIKKAGVFLILAQTLLHLCVADSFEKYIKMIVGLVTVMMLVFPVIAYFREEDIKSFDEYREAYEKEIFGDTPDFDQIRDENWKTYLKLENISFDSGVENENLSGGEYEGAN